MAATEETQVSPARAWLKPAQVDRLLEHTDIFRHHLQLRNEVAVLLMYDTGIRVGELVKLDVGHIRLDDDDPYIFLPGRIQKHPPTGGTPDPANINLRRSLGTARLLRHYLNSRWRDTEAVFPSQKADRMGTEQVRNVVSKLAHAADIHPYTADGDGRGGPDGVTPHTLRHSVFYREFVNGDAKLKEVSLRLRHTSIATTERIYSHVVRR